MVVPRPISFMNVQMTPTAQKVSIPSSMMSPRPHSNN